ncbi:MAG: hypothetical protein HYU66_03695 [Armatimonadetes bacterium]|nr:hypothetical protein [Armatimonadota bacterium]
MSLRALLLGLLLVPLQAFWIIHMELVRGGIWPTVLSLLFTCVFFVFVLAVLNLAARRWLPRLALRDEELLAVYIVLAAGASLSGCDVGQTLVHVLGAPYHFATDSNHWTDHFGRYLPERILVQNEDALKDFYRGNSSLYTWDHLRWWLGPVASWLGFILGMLAAMLSLCLLVRRQWVEHERLSFPIVQVPLAMTCSPGFFRSPKLWWGFALAGGLDLLNGLHELVPAAPVIHCKQAFQLGGMFTSAPWNAVGWLPITVYPFAVGLGYLMPHEMSFSCVIGFFLWKAQKVFWAFRGMPPPGLDARFAQEQLAGVWIAVVVFAAWTGRHEWRKLWHDRARQGSTRWVLLLGVAGVAEMICFAHRAGMTWGFGAAYMLVYLGFSLALTRMRAEFGPPCHDLYGAGPDRIFMTWAGEGAILPRNLTGMAVMYWLSRESPRSHPMPHQLEALYLGGGRLDRRKLAAAILAGGTLSGFVTFWVTLHYGYVRGSETGFFGPATWFATEGFRRLDSYLTNPKPVDHPSQAAMVIAFVASLLALHLRSNVLWFTFHPAGYAISSWWAIHLLWFPLTLAWAIKRSVTRYGGARSYRAWRPFFFGLILGEFVVGSLWQLAALLGRFTAYAFWI